MVYEKQTFGDGKHLASPSTSEVEVDKLSHLAQAKEGNFGQTPPFFNFLSPLVHWPISYLFFLFFFYIYFLDFAFNNLFS